MAPKDGSARPASKEPAMPRWLKDDPDDVFGGANHSRGRIASTSSAPTSSEAAPFSLEEREFMASHFQLRHLPPITSQSTPPFLGLARHYLEFLLSPDTAEEARVLLRLVNLKERHMSSRLLNTAPLSAQKGEDIDGDAGKVVATRGMRGEQSIIGQKREPKEQESRQARVRRRLANLESEG